MNGTELGDTPAPDEKIAPEDVELDEQEDKVTQIEGRVRKEDIWNEMFLTSSGRDKGFVRLLDSFCLLPGLTCSVTETYPI